MYLKNVYRVFYKYEINLNDHTQILAALVEVEEILSICIFYSEFKAQGTICHSRKRLR